MTEIRDSRRPNLATRQFWYGLVASDPVDLSDFIDVIVPDFDLGFKWTGVRWQSRDLTSMPGTGDECLIVLDNRNQPWVIAWWPFT